MFWRTYFERSQLSSRNFPTSAKTLKQKRTLKQKSLTHIFERLQIVLHVAVQSRDHVLPRLLDQVLGQRQVADRAERVLAQLQPALVLQLVGNLRGVEVR